MECGVPAYTLYGHSDQHGTHNLHWCDILCSGFDGYVWFVLVEKTWIFIRDPDKTHRKIWLPQPSSMQRQIEPGGSRCAITEPTGKHRALWKAFCRKWYIITINKLLCHCEFSNLDFKANNSLFQSKGKIVHRNYALPGSKGSYPRVLSEHFVTFPHNSVILSEVYRGTTDYHNPCPSFLGRSSPF